MRKYRLKPKFDIIQAVQWIRQYLNIKDLEKELGMETGEFILEQASGAGSFLHVHYHPANSFSVGPGDFIIKHTKKRRFERMSERAFKNKYYEV